MATVNQWIVPETIATALSTELNSLANGGNSAASAAINNESGLYLYINLELVLTSLTPTGSPRVDIYLIKSIDNGTNYEDTTPLSTQLLASFAFTTSVSAKRAVITGLLIPPLQFKLLAQQNMGPALAAASNVLRYRRNNEQAI